MELRIMRLEDRIVLDGAAAAVVAQAVATAGTTAASASSTSTSTSTSAKTADTAATSKSDAAGSDSAAVKSSDSTAASQPASTAVTATDKGTTASSATAASPAEAAATSGATASGTSSTATVAATATAETAPAASAVDKAGATASGGATSTSEPSESSSATSAVKAAATASDSATADSATNATSTKTDGAAASATVLAVAADAAVAQTADSAGSSSTAGKTSATAAATAAPDHVLVVASDVSNAADLVASVNKDTIGLLYDPGKSTADDVLKMVADALNGAKAQSIGLATGGLGAGQIELAKDAPVSKDSLDASQSLQGFCKSLGGLLDDSGRIDILASDAGVGVSGAQMIAAIKSLSGKDVAASVNATGNSASGGDWVLETRNVDAAATYFDTEKLAKHSGLLDGASGASSAMADTSASSEPVCLLMVASSVKEAQVLAADAASGVITLVYDIANSPDKVLALVTQALGGKKADSVALATHSSGDGQFILTADCEVNAASALGDSGIQAFWMGLGAQIKAGGAIDLLPCNLAGSDAGQITVAAIASASGRTVNASTNATGNPASGGDWILEQGGVNLAATYFRTDKLGNYSGLLLSETGFTIAIPTYATTSGDNFAKAVAISGDYAVVGAPSATAAAYGGGLQANTGLAYVYYKNSGSWGLQATLAQPQNDTMGGDYFGCSVAISGDYIIVGAYNQGSRLGLSNAGGAYIFHRSGTSWTQSNTYILGAANAAVSDNLGYSVAISMSGSTGWAFAGARQHMVGVKSNQGAVYAYYFDGTSWGNGTGTRNSFTYIMESQTLTSSDGASGDYFGTSTAMSGNYAIISSPYKTVGGATYRGEAYIYYLSGSTWAQQAMLTASDGAANDQFGELGGVAISGDYAVVGAQFHDTASRSNQGQAYVYVRSGTTWTEQAMLSNSDGAVNDRFGVSVGIDGDKVIVGASGKTVGGNSTSGAAYVFTRSGTTWTQDSSITPSDGAANLNFGYSVGISGSTYLVGAYGKSITYNSITHTYEGKAYFFASGPTIGGVSVGQIVNDNATIKPFSSITVTDTASSETVTVSLDTAAKGSFTTLNGFSLSGSNYTYTGSPSECQAALRGMVFTPTPHRSSVGSTETTTFTVNVSGTSTTTTVITTATNSRPSLGCASKTGCETDPGQPSPGDTINSLLSSDFSTPFSSYGLAGIAVIGNTANATTQGTWQFYYNSAGGWETIPSGTLSASSALMLCKSTQIRFAPVAGFTGVAPALSFLVVDSTYPTSPHSTYWSEPALYANSSSPSFGSSLSFSSGSYSISINVKSSSASATIQGVTIPFTPLPPINPNLPIIPVTPITTITALTIPYIAPVMEITLLPKDTAQSLNATAILAAVPSFTANSVFISSGMDSALATASRSSQLFFLQPLSFDTGHVVDSSVKMSQVQALQDKIVRIEADMFQGKISAADALTIITTDFKELKITNPKNVEETALVLAEGNRMMTESVKRALNDVVNEVIVASRLNDVGGSNMQSCPPLERVVREIVASRGITQQTMVRNIQAYAQALFISERNSRSRSALEMMVPIKN